MRMQNQHRTVVVLGSILTGCASAAAQSSRVCSVESGLQVCRDVVAPPVRVEQVVAKPEPRGKLLFLLDIPANIFGRLGQSVEQNRQYTARSDWNYRPPPPPPSGAGKYNPARAPGPAAWQYHPKTDYSYRPKQESSYDPNVFKRIWTSNIQHDTRVVEVPTESPGVILIPVQDVR